MTTKVKPLRWVSGSAEFWSSAVTIPVKTGNRFERFRAAVWRDWGDNRLYHWSVQRQGYHQPEAVGDAWTKSDARKRAETALWKLIEDVVRVASL
jgi:hypothetical protein